MIQCRGHMLLIEEKFNEELESNAKKKEGMENSPFYRLSCIAASMRKISIDGPTLVCELGCPGSPRGGVHIYLKAL